jgi:hypothetical protein
VTIALGCITARKSLLTMLLAVRRRLTLFEGMSRCLRRLFCRKLLMLVSMLLVLLLVLRLLLGTLTLLQPPGPRHITQFQGSVRLYSLFKYIFLLLLKDEGIGHFVER